MLTLIKKMKKNKELYIIRHAKAERESITIKDIDRSLTGKGITQAYLMAEKLANQVADLNLIICSPAIRALHTATIFARKMNISLSKIILEKSIYTSEFGNTIDLIKHTPDDLDSLMIFGHNPSLSETVNHFSLDFIDFLPTCGVIKLKFNTDKWTDCGRNNSELEFCYYPQEK